MSPIAIKAEVYEALCDVSQSTLTNNDSSIEVSKCQITLSDEGFLGPTDFIHKNKISQWYSVRQKDNLLLGVAGTAGGTYTGAIVGIAVCGASAGILCIPALLGGVYGGGRLGSQVGKGKNFLFSVIGQNSEGNTVAQNFRTLERKTSKKLKKELAEITGLKMGQVKIIGK
ncbi:hypothetical protein [Prochlorococcus marinus]|uniref:hypothetical protein n=1 Tax=Prochlorococcus marinus TaxID=1219 RepID=UPI00214BF50D|nr:hypothetical protein [Prochlorococcus marinus]